MPYGIDHAIHDVANAPEGYVAAHGILQFDASKLPKVDWNKQQDTPPLTRIRARLKGHALTKQGFTHKMNAPVTLEVSCYGPWCAAPPSGKHALVFLQKTDAGYVLETNPCGGLIFFDPTDEALKKVQRCYLEGHCPKPPQP